MEVRVQGKKEAPLKGIDPVLAEINQRLQSHPQEWLRSLQKNPAGFGDLEKKVHHAVSSAFEAGQKRAIARDKARAVDRGMSQES